MKRRGIFTLSAFYFIYFIYMGISTFSSRYYAQIGLTESQIGILNSVPALVSMCLMPMWGTLSDRMKYKKTLVVVNSILGGLAFLLVDFCTDFSLLEKQTTSFQLVHGATRFLPLLLIVIINSVFIQPNSSVAASVSMEYAESVGFSYGPIRMMGTVGYIVGSIVIGFACKDSLRYLYAWMGVGLIATGLDALTMPNIGGHQHNREKISPLVLLKDARVRLLLAMVFIAACTTMFYQAFFGAFLNDMHVKNSIHSVITWVSVVLEIPMLFFSSKIMKRFSIWKWIIIGLVLNGIRWLGFFAAAKVGSWPLLMVFQLLAVTANATFEIFPTLYLGQIIAPELSSTAQTTLNFITFGLARVVGALLGGFICQSVGYGAMFALWGVVLLAAAAIFTPICIRQQKRND